MLHPSSFSLYPLAFTLYPSRFSLIIAGMTAAAQSERSARFLVTGAKGFIGAWIVKNLVERGDEPWIFDLDSTSHRLEAIISRDLLAKLHFVRGDVTDFGALERAIREHGITHVIHLAALQVPGCAADPRRGAEVNVLGTINVFESARRSEGQVRSVVYASSAAVFGPEEFYGGKTVPEGAQLLPGTHYGVFKQTNEANARVYFLDHGLPSIGLRPWAVYGVGRDVGITSGPTKAIKAAALGRPYTIRFTGGVDFQYVNDTARIFLKCAESQKGGARVYTLRGTVIRMQVFIAALEREIPAARGLIRADGPQLPIAYDLNDSALVRDLGEVPRTPLEQGIRETGGIFDELRREGRLDASDLES
jgi:UDP-glucose 4-epimerase